MQTVFMLQLCSAGDQLNAMVTGVDLDKQMCLKQARTITVQMVEGRLLRAIQVNMSTR